MNKSLPVELKVAGAGGGHPFYIGRDPLIGDLFLVCSIAHAPGAFITGFSGMQAARTVVAYLNGCARGRFDPKELPLAIRNKLLEDILAGKCMIGRT